MGTHLTAMGNLEGALASFARAEAIAPASLWWELGRWNVFVLDEEWDRAEIAARKLSAADDPFWKWEGGRSLGAVNLYRGKSRPALADYDDASAAYAEGGSTSARARAIAAHVLLETGNAEGALAQAQRAQRDGKSDVAESQGMFYAALAQARLGRHAEADALAESLRRKAESLPTAKEKRRHTHLLGELALLRGRPQDAIAALSEAEAALPPRGFHLLVGTDHVPIWYALGQASMAAGDGTAAERWFRRVTESTTEHATWPIPYVRSFFLLAKAQEKRGDE